MADAQLTADLLLKVSSFSRYLLDKVLSSEICGKQAISSDTLKNLVDECDALAVSLRSFTQLTKVLQGSVAVSISCQADQERLPDNGNLSSSLQNTKHDCLKFIELCEMIRKKVMSFPDLTKLRPYYCKICNLATIHREVFNQHCASKKHVEQTNQTLEPLKIYKCKVCHLLLMTPQSEVNSITSLPGHTRLDEHIQKLKESTDKLHAKHEVNDTLHKSDMVKIPDENIPEVSDITVKPDTPEVHLVPQKVYVLFHMMRKKLKKDGTNLSEIVPHYCSICDVMADSVSKFIEHNSYKKHISIVNSVIEPINVFKCEKCGFLITGYQLVIDSIISSLIHRNFDEYIRTLKASKETGKNVNANIPLLSDLEALDSNTSPIIKTSKRSFIPQDLKKAIHNLMEKLRLPTDLKKMSPAYCYICVKRFFTDHDFKQHLASKKHNLLASSSTSFLHIHNCPTCLISLYGTETEIINAMDSIEHIDLHNRITYLFHGNLVDTDTSKSASNQEIPKSSPILESDSFPNKTICSNNCEVRKSLWLNEVVEGSNQNINISQNNQDVIKDSKGNLASGYKRLDQGIPDKFLTINSKLQCENFSKSGFCRPCKKGVNIMKGWTSHLLCSKHMKAMEKYEFQNIPLPCNYCPLQILGDEAFGNVCMNIHMQSNHPNEKFIDTQDMSFSLTVKEVKDEMTSVLSFVCSENSSVESKSPERTECNESSHIGENFLELRRENEEKCVIDMNTSIQTTLLCNSKDLSSSQHSFESDSSTIESKNNCVVVFTQFIKKRKSVFLNEGLKQFGGMCLFCAHTFEDYYDWIIHLKDPCHNKINRNEVVERECSNCNLSLYGKKVVIDSEFWPLKEHVSLDTLIIQ